jgi:hypothetical protein
MGYERRRQSGNSPADGRGLDLGDREGRAAARIATPTASEPAGMQPPLPQEVAIGRVLQDMQRFP